MQVRCPSCHDPIDVDDECPLADISCPSCGSDFKLLSVAETIATRGPGGRTMGHFELLEQVGVGQFGSVWKARDKKLDRVVAVKMPRKGDLTESETEQFLREARAAARLRHPNIVSVHEVGSEAGSVYIVSDFVQGVTLSDWLTARRHSPREAAELCAKIAEALHHAHESGVVHRDLKPGNIMMSPGGEPHIMDFGLAKRDAGEVTMTMDGAVLGTPAYMSPEQAKGEAHTADRRSDVYSLGVILFQLLTGELPFRGNARMLLQQVLNDDPPSPRKFNLRVPRDLETICLKCLEKDPRRRFATAEELAGELRRFLRGEPILSRPVGRVQRAVRWCRRNPVVASLSATALALLVAVAVVGMVGYVQTTLALRFARQRETDAIESQKESDEAARRARQANEQAQADRQALQTNLVDTFTSFGLAADERNEPASAALWFAEASRMASDDPLRERFNRLRASVWSQIVPRPVRALPRSTEQLRDLSFHPSGRYLLVRNSQFHTIMWDLVEERQIAWPDDLPTPTAATWNLDGSLLAITMVGRVDIRSFPSLEKVAEIPHPTFVATLTFSRDGNMLVIAGRHLQVWSVAQRRCMLGPMDLGAKTESAVLDNAAQHLAITGQDGIVRAFALEGLNRGADEESTPNPQAGDDPAHETTSELQPLWSAGYSFRSGGRGENPITTAFAFVGTGPRRSALMTIDESTVILRDTETGAPMTRYNNSKVIYSAAVSPDNRLLVVGSYPEAAVIDLTQNRVWPKLAHANTVLSVSFSPDATMFATASLDRTVRIWSSQTGQQVSSPLYHPNAVHLVAFSADGRHLATAQEGGLVRIWALPQVDGYSIPIEGTTTLAALSPQGKYVVASGCTYRGRTMHTTKVYESATGTPVSPELSGAAVAKGGLFSHLLERVTGSAGNARDGASQPINHAAFSSDGERLALITTGRLVVFDWRRGVPVFPAVDIPNEPRHVSFSPDDHRIAVLCADGTLQAFDSHGASLAQWNAASRFKTDNDYVNNGMLRFTPDGRYIVTWGIDEKVVAWNAESGQPGFSVELERLTHDVQFSSDGKLIALAALDNTARVYDFASGEALIEPLGHPDWVFAARFSPDDKYLLTASRDSMARLWDWRKRELVCPPFKHDNEVMDVGFVPGEPLVMTVSHDHSIRFWEWYTGKPVTPPSEHRGMCWQGTITPDGQYAVVGGFTQELRVHRLATLHERDEVPADLLCLRAEVLSGQEVHSGGDVTNLTTEEWLQRWQQLKKAAPESFTRDGEALTTHLHDDTRGE